MIYPVLLGTAVLAVCGIFLCIRSMVRLAKEKEHKMLICVIAVFVGIPLLVAVVLFVGAGRINIWIRLLLFVFIAGWILEGFFIDAYLKQEKKRKLEGRAKLIPARPAHVIRKQCLILAGSLVVWCVGAFIGIPNPMLETVLLSASIFLLVRSLAKLWKYRGF